MTKKVLKFGGTSVGSIQRIVHAAKIVKKEHDSGNKVIVVVSAMAGTTNNLIAHSQSISKKFDKRELDADRNLIAYKLDVMMQDIAEIKQILKENK